MDSARDAAHKKFKIADHILTQTYPLVKDPKLLLAVIQNIHDCLLLGVSAILEHERRAKRAPAYSESFESKMITFTQHVVPALRIPREYIRFIHEIREIVKEHRESPVEFIRDRKFVIADNEYHLTKLSTEQLRPVLEKTKSFMSVMDRLTQ